MKIVSVTKVRNEWPTIEAGVARGETYLVKKRNKKVAVITRWKEGRAPRKSTSANLLRGTAVISVEDLLASENWYQD